MIGKFSKVLNFKQLFLRLSRLFVTSIRFSPFTGLAISKLNHSYFPHSFWSSYEYHIHYHLKIMVLIKWSYMFPQLC